ncbi:uncharacterized protein O3Q21_011824 isoform 1-T11 [Podargus strigoides]
MCNRIYSLDCFSAAGCVLCAGPRNWQNREVHQSRKRGDLKRAGRMSDEAHLGKYQSSLLRGIVEELSSTAGLRSVISHQRSSDFLSLGTSGTTSDDSLGTRLRNERVRKRNPVPAGTAQLADAFGISLSRMDSDP